VRVCSVCGPAGQVKSPFAECPRSGSRQSFFFNFFILRRVPPGLALGKEDFFLKKNSFPSAPDLALGKVFFLFF